MGTSFLSIFAKSPFNAIQEHMQTVCACSNALLPFFEAVLTKNWEEVTQKQKEIVRLEAQADELKKKIRLHLPSNLFLPVSRSDILELLKVQDKIANVVKDIAGLVLGRKMTIPELFGDLFLGYVQSAIEATGQAAEVIFQLDELLEVGFKGHEAVLVEEMIVQLDDFEKKTDDIQIKIRSSLFSIEHDLKAVDVMFLYKIIDWVGEVADYAQQVGHRLQLLLAK